MLVENSSSQSFKGFANLVNGESIDPLRMMMLALVVESDERLRLVNLRIPQVRTIFTLGSLSSPLSLELLEFLF
jgi:hypothetical protein